MPKKKRPVGRPPTIIIPPTTRTFEQIIKALVRPVKGKKEYT